MSSHTLFRRLGLTAGCVLLCFVPAWSATYYVDCNRPDDLGDGLTLATAKQTIQAAVDLAAANDTVLVAKGVYDKGGKAEGPGWPTNRVCVTKPITIKAISDNPADTVISGAADPNSDPTFPNADFAARAKGLGQSAIRCYRCTRLVEPKGALIGFTLKDGHTWFDPVEERLRKKPRGGGADNANIGGGALDGVLSNCVIVACKANRGGAVSYCKVYNSVIRNCVGFAGGGASYPSCDFYNCEFTGNTGLVCMFDTTAVNCVFRGNSGGIAGYPSERPVYHRLYNCLITENSGSGMILGLNQGVKEKNVPLLVNCTVVSNWITGQKDTPLFVSRRTGQTPSIVMSNCIVRFNCNTNAPGVECNGMFNDESDISNSCISPDVTGKPYDKGGNIATWPAKDGMGASGHLGVEWK
ncbi:MAG: right-handed parallel beta-helix repeat-containing protein [Kiritimatiellae bacterium]|nr:right-handed parallel beta-helix repeat-containing protein [Kiritimatiellia bacterium]